MASVKLAGGDPSTELDLATCDGVVEQGYAAIARSARLLLHAGRWDSHSA